MRWKRMAEINRSLRRHYPHQVQGVVQKSDLSATTAPPHYELTLSRNSKVQSRNSAEADRALHRSMLIQAAKPQLFQDRPRSGRSLVDLRNETSRGLRAR